MKKLTAILVLFFYAGTALFADSLLFFPGIMSDTVVGNTGQTSQVAMSKSMVSNPNYAGSNQVIFGSSQGGFRALVYAEQVRRNRNNPNQSVKGIITFDSPIQGHWALSKGKAALASRFSTRLNRTIKAYDSLLEPVDGVMRIFNQRTIDLSEMGLGVLPISDVKTFDALLLTTALNAPDNVGYLDFLMNGATDGNFGMNAAVVDEFVPGSAAIQEFISPVTTPGYMGQKLVGMYVWEQIGLKWGWLKVYGWVWRQVPTAVWVPPVTTKRLDASVKLAHIVGNDNDPLNMISAQATYLGKPGFERTGLGIGQARIASVFGAAAAFYDLAVIGNTSAAVGSPNAGMYLAAAAECTTRSFACSDTAWFMAFLPTAYGNELLLTTENDGFTTVDQMVTPDTNATWMNGGNKSQSIIKKKLNHSTMCTDPSLWGDKGDCFYTNSVGKTYMENGVEKQTKLDELLNAMQTRERSGTGGL
jgi:hypothetical protein